MQFGVGADKHLELVGSQGQGPRDKRICREDCLKDELSRFWDYLIQRPQSDAPLGSVGTTMESIWLWKVLVRRVQER